jgi:protein-tyrosine phosphatase
VQSSKHFLEIEFTGSHWIDVNGSTEQRAQLSTQDSIHARQARVLTLQGGCNFRDIGGYAGAGGTVRWGRVYRTGVLSYLTSDDHRMLADCSVASICDLRRSEERAREPTRWPDAAVQLLEFPDTAQVPTIRGFAAHHPPTPHGMRAAMLDLYRALPAWMAPRLKGMFECIAAGRTPLIVHCAAGKDRTGVAIAVLLHMLGVATDTIVEDYVLTNTAGNFEQFIRGRVDSQLGLADHHHPLLAMDPDIRQVLFGAEPEYLQAAFNHIDAELGGMQAYLRTLVRVDTEIVQRTRQALLM